MLARTTAPASCVLGQTWDYDATGVWVDKGCRAEFGLGNPDPGGPENTDLNAFFGLLEPYGRLRGHVAWFNDGVEVQDDASFLGMNFSTRGKVKFFAKVEWGVSLVRGGQQFNPGQTTSGGGYPFLDDPQAGQVFGNRLGNVGVDFGPFGRITVGKQWGVHTDVSLYTTDQFVVFGSQASATYTAGTDGGFLGNGRADQTVSYHGTFFKVLRLGGQLQFKVADDSDAVDGAGVSAQVTILPGVRVGAAYTKSFVDDEVINTIRGLDDDAEFAAVGASINWKVFEAAVVYANQSNGDLARLRFGSIERAIAFDAEGVEALVRFSAPKFSVYGGLNYYLPDSDDPLTRSRFPKALWHRRRQRRDHPQHVHLRRIAHLRRQHRRGGRGRLQRARHRRPLRVHREGISPPLSPWPCFCPRWCPAARCSRGRDIVLRTGCGPPPE